MESGTELSKEWISLQVDINSRDLLDVFFRTQSHKTINRHGSTEWKCSMHTHENSNGEDLDNRHLMSVEYRKCVATACHEQVDLECSFQYKIVECKKTNKFYVYQSGEHLEPNNNKTEKIRGINDYFKIEIKRILNENTVMEPKNIHIVMTKLKNDGKYGPFAAVFPTLSQVRSYSSRIKKNLGGDDGFEIVVNFVKEMEYFHGIVIVFILFL